MSLYQRLLNSWTKRPKTFATILVVIALCIGAVPDLVMIFSGSTEYNKAYGIGRAVCGVFALAMMAFGFAVIILSDVLTTHHRQHTHETPAKPPKSENQHDH